jgi:hypothetical protein
MVLEDADDQTTRLHLYEELLNFERKVKYQTLCF